ncbi:MAG: MATE family efflux transporter [Candidatus Muirbacterium halophilum]|nr:MATE family efflux transporter [Candidatus Muirbacterium halophilum]MCK9476294.1 MATE family efflux transporter [Candidatus Muirbacterium halophilum]
MYKKIIDKLLDAYNRKIISIAFPAILSMFFIVFYELIDSYWLNKLGYEEVFSSLGAASFITWSLYSLMHLVTAGVNSLVSQYSGAKNKEKYHLISFNGYFAGFFLSLGITLIMAYFYKDIFILSGLKNKILEDACSYFSIMNAGFLVIFLLSINTSIFNSHGDTKTSMKIQISTLLFNAIIDPVFILGFWKIPSFGIKGAAIASILCQFIGLTIGIIILIKKDYISKNFKKPDLYIIKKIFLIGLPIAVINWIFSMVFPALTFIIQKTGNPNALGALNICHKLEGFAYFSATGFSVAACTLAGQSIGQNNKNKAQKYVNRSVILCTIVTGFLSLIYFFIPEYILSIIVDSPKLIEEGANYLRAIAVFEIFLGFEIVYEGGFTGLGKTITPMLISVPLTLARIPFAYFFAVYLELGVVPIWWVISLSTFFKGLFILILFKKQNMVRPI